MSACSMTGSAATTLFVLTTTTSRFKLKGRSVKWEVFLYDGMSIYVDRDRAEVLPRGVLPASLCNDRCRGWSRQFRPLLELLLDKVVDMPVGVQRQLLVSTCRKLRSLRSFSSYRGVTGWVFRTVYTGTRPGVSPAIRAGKGWRGRRELAPRRSATRISCMRWRISTETCVIHHVRTTTTTTTTTTTQGLFHQECSFSFVSP